MKRRPPLPPSPNWTPASAGVVPEFNQEIRAAPPPNLHPGEGRGPVGTSPVMKHRPPSRPSPNWTPASAGVVPELKQDTRA